MGQRKASALKVLIVEDHPALRKLYSTPFMQRGFRVYTAGDGASALEKFRNKAPDIVLLDIMLPEKDGIEVLREIRRNPCRYVPVIMLSNVEREDFALKEELGEIDEYLLKARHSPEAVVEKTLAVLKLNRVAG